MTDGEIYLTEAELAARCRIGRRTVQRWRQNGEGPAWARIGLRRIVYRLRDVEEWLASRTFVDRDHERSDQRAT